MKIKFIIMKIIVFGASGRTGRRVCRMALDHGHEVTAFIQESETLDLNEENLLLVKGDIFNEAKVALNIQGKDAVISVIGEPTLDVTTHVRSVGMKVIVESMEAAGVDRLVAVAGAGILDQNGTAADMIMDDPNFPPAFLAVSREHLDAFNRLKSSDIKWTIVCPPPTLIEEGPTGHYRIAVNKHPGGNHVTYGDMAKFIVTEVEKGKYTHNRIGITD
jgi:putative NADH-flavin reductase